MKVFVPRSVQRPTSVHAEYPVFHVWISWQTNPANIGRHSQAVAPYDGGTPLMTARRTLTVFP